jgi:hypothetical protein
VKNNRRQKQGKFGLAAVVTVLIAILAGLVLAAAVNTLIYPNTANVNQITDIQAYVNSVQWANNTPIDWGPVDRDTTYSKNFEVKNNGNVAISHGYLLVIVNGLPLGWTETYSLNGTYVDLDPQMSVSGTLDLYVPFDAVPGPADWTMSLSVT